MSIGILLKLLPWNLVGKVVLGVIELVVEDTDNEYDDALVDVVNDVLAKAEDKHPDQ